MTTSSLVIEVIGRPAPQGSKRYVGNGVMVESSKGLRPWREAIRAAAVAAAERHAWPLAVDQPFAITAVFTLARPAGHYRSGRYADLLRDNAPAHPATRPDLDKLIRSTLDALADAAVISDDARVVHLDATKAYPGGHLDALDAPGAVIVLTALQPQRKAVP
jgi:Holliday junction resolvase RusA-like endonuclease